MQFYTVKHIIPDESRHTLQGEICSVHHAIRLFGCLVGSAAKALYCKFLGIDACKHVPAVKCEVRCVATYLAHPGNFSGLLQSATEPTPIVWELSNDS